MIFLNQNRTMYKVYRREGSTPLAIANSGGPKVEYAVYMKIFMELCATRMMCVGNKEIYILTVNQEKEEIRMGRGGRGGR